jgi:hypothetical protein
LHCANHDQTESKKSQQSLIHAISRWPISLPDTGHLLIAFGFGFAAVIFFSGHCLSLIAYTLGITLIILGAYHPLITAFENVQGKH